LSLVSALEGVLRNTPTELSHVPAWEPAGRP
jgi:hypothetical protein